MVRIELTIEGTTPLLLNRFTDEAQMKATTGAGSSLVGDRGTPREIAETKLYVDPAGVIGIPTPNMLRCFIDAGKFFKSGKSKVTTQKSSLIPACLSIDGVMLPIVHKEPWTVDTRPVRIPSTGGRILCHRPCYMDWSLGMELELDDSIIGVKTLRDIVDAAGSRIGLGDFRPDCKGPFGKFKVTKWSTTNGAAKG